MVTAAPVVGTCGRVGEGECNMWSIGNVPVTTGNIQVTNVMYRKLNNKVVISHIISKQEIHTNTKREKKRREYDVPHGNRVNCAYHIAYHTIWHTTSFFFVLSCGYVGVSV